MTKPAKTKGRRGRGRPPLDENDSSVGVQVNMPGKKYDELYSQASRHGLSVPEVIRRRARITTPTVVGEPATPTHLGLPRSFWKQFRVDLYEALGVDHDLTPELAKCFHDDLYAFVKAPWGELLEGLHNFSETIACRVPLDDEVRAAALILRAKLLAHDAFISGALQNPAAAGRAGAAEPARSRGVAFVRGRVDRLAEVTRSVVIRPMNSPALTAMLNALIAWGDATVDESRRFEPRRRRGRVSDHRREWLAHQTMRHLESIGIPLSCTNHGALANVLRVILAAADRLEEKSPAERDDLRNDLKRWLSTYPRGSNSTAGC